MNLKTFFWQGHDHGHGHGHGVNVSNWTLFPHSKMAVTHSVTQAVTQSPRAGIGLIVQLKKHDDETINYYITLVEPAIHSRLFGVLDT